MFVFLFFTLLSAHKTKRPPKSDIKSFLWRLFSYDIIVLTYLFLFPIPFHIFCCIFFGKPKFYLQPVYRIFPVLTDGLVSAVIVFVLAGNIAEFLVFAANKFFSTFLTIILDLFRYFHLIVVLVCDAKIGSGFGTCKGL